MEYAAGKALTVEIRMAPPMVQNAQRNTTALLYLVKAVEYQRVSERHNAPGEWSSNQPERGLHYQSGSIQIATRTRVGSRVAH